MNINQAYQYQALRHPDSIRVLELLPGGPGTTLQCKIHEVRKTERPRFEALPYTWGAPVFPKRLTEITAASFLHVTENLSDALQALRVQSSSRLLWIDAVCIDQQNTSEKNQQVAQMGDVYRDAERVLVWLGNEDCKAGVEELSHIGRKSEIYGFEKIFPFPIRMHDHSAGKNLEELVQRCDWAAVREFLDRQWFERVWIVQEFLLAKDVILFSGKSEITYDLFSKAICTLVLTFKRPVLLRRVATDEIPLNAMMDGKLDQAWSLIQNRERYIALNTQNATTTSNFPSAGPQADPASVTGGNDNSDQLAFEKGAGQSTEHTLEGDETILPSTPLKSTIHHSTLVEYCVTAMHLKCTNERDRVYGMLGIAGETLSIKPDYGSSPEHVWKDLAIESLLSGDLTVLHWARGIPGNSTSRGLSSVADLGKLSSGVLRFGGFGTPKFQAGSQVAAQVELIPQGLPKLGGVVIDVVNNEGFIGAQATTPTAAEEYTTASESLTVPDGHDQEKAPVQVSKEILVQLFELCRSWVSSSPCQYEEGFIAAFARTILADKALPSTQQIIGEEKETMVPYLVLLALSLEVPQVEGRLFVPDRLVAETLGSSYELGLQTFDSDKPSMYYFPAKDEPDLIWRDPDDNTTQTYVEITEPLKARLTDYKLAVSQLLRSRSIFSTAKGYIGLGPMGMAQDDEVVVFEGAQTPFVLRRIGVFVSQPSDPPEAVQKTYPIYQMVGECYLHGWMYGEAMDKEHGLERQEIVLA